VIRKITVLLSLAVTGGGIWLLTRVHSVIAACSSIASPLTGTGLKPQCMNSLSLYFLGFAFTICGIVVLSLATFTMKKSPLSLEISRIGDDISTLDERYRDTHRDVA
jgi:hypothetical protein